MMTCVQPASLSIADRDLAGERALGLPVDVLRARAGCALPAIASRDGLERREGRREQTSRPRTLADAAWRARAASASASLRVPCIFQLPARSGMRAHRHAPIRAPATPGSSCPRGTRATRRRRSRRASRRRACRRGASAATESPPPTTVVPVHAASACAIAIVPALNASISKMPIGPVPEDGARRGDLAPRNASRVCRADVDAEEVVGERVGRDHLRCGAGLGPVGGEVVHRQQDARRRARRGARQRLARDARPCRPRRASGRPASPARGGTCTPSRRRCRSTCTRSSRSR